VSAPTAPPASAFEACEPTAPPPLRTLVHVGYHKTATTWFQRRVYPRVSTHRPVERAAVRRAFLAPGPFDFDPAEALRVLASAGSPPWILCEEELSGNPHAGGLMGLVAKEMAERLRAAFPDAAIVVFLRRQHEAIAACYAQYLRQGGTHGPRRYAFPHEGRRGFRAAPWKAPAFRLGYFDYAALVKHYDARFGRERVHVFLYEELRADPAGFLAGFAARLGLALDADPRELAGPRENVSLGRRLLPLARALNHFSARNVADKRVVAPLLPDRVRRALLEALNRPSLAGAPPDPRRLLGPALADAIAERFAAGNRRLAAERGLPLGRHGYPGAPTAGGS
jgi:hypothetical protein